MAEPRKVFRIEEGAAARHVRASAGTPASAYHTEIMQALSALRAAVAFPSPPPPARDGADRDGTSALQTAQLARITQELEAVVTSTAQATQKVLTAAEEIDQLANNLSAALKDKIDQGAAQDISDLVIRIFEACNFQDLTGQRINKVMTMLKLIEDSARGPGAIEAPPPRDDSAQHLHGPRLDTDSGHMNQDDIDALFGGWSVPTS